jgi:pyruvate dehydrogenase E2 component (dihydrolipoamide acetyltransferase)
VTTFHLPDLGEGLQEAEIVAWHVKEGDAVQVDQLMVSVETAKAVVEVPSPYSGTITRLLAKAGEVVATHQALVEFDLGAAEPAKPADATPAAPSSMTVVGRMNVSDADWDERAAPVASERVCQPAQRLRAAPAVRMLAKRLKIDLTGIKATGKHGLITVDDVLNSAGLSRQGSRTSHYQMPPGRRLAGEFEPITGARRASKSMVLSRDEIAMVTDSMTPTCIAGRARSMTARIARALCRELRAEPALNAVFDPTDRHAAYSPMWISALPSTSATNCSSR